MCIEEQQFSRSRQTLLVVVNNNFIGIVIMCLTSH